MKYDYNSSDSVEFQNKLKNYVYNFRLQKKAVTLIYSYVPIVCFIKNQLCTYVHISLKRLKYMFLAKQMDLVNYK